MNRFLSMGFRPHLLSTAAVGVGIAGYYSAQCASNKEYEYLIIGGGNAAGYACKQFVDGGATKGSNKLCMISGEDVLPYERPALSKGFLLKPALDVPKFNTCAFFGQSNDTKYYNENGIDTKLATNVVDVDFDKKTVKTDKNEQIKYNKLLLATGCSLVKFSNFMRRGICDFSHIYYIRDRQDALKLRQTMHDSSFKEKECVVIGGGYIGMEVTSAILSAGSFKKVTMVIPENHMMDNGLFTPEIAKRYHDLYEKHGVHFIQGSMQYLVKQFHGDWRGNVTGVTLKSGQKLPAQVVVAGIGARPNTELFKGKLEIDQNNRGLMVNKYLQSTSDPDVFGCGDIISFDCPFYGSRARLEHVRHARSSAMYAARAMTGELTPNDKKDGYTFLPVFYSRVFAQSWIFWGMSPNNDPKYEMKMWSHDVPCSDSKKERAFNLMAVWYERASGKVVGVFVDTDDGDAKKMAEKAVSSGQSIKDIKPLIAKFDK